MAGGMEKTAKQRWKLSPTLVRNRSEALLSNKPTRASGKDKVSSTTSSNPSDFHQHLSHVLCVVLFLYFTAPLNICHCYRYACAYITGGISHAISDELF